jgi:hypothetical protein
VRPEIATELTPSGGPADSRHGRFIQRGRNAKDGHMAQYGQGIGFNSRTFDGGLAGYISRHRTENGTMAAVAAIGLLVAVGVYAAVKAPGVAGLIVVGAGALFLMARAALSSRQAGAAGGPERITKAIVEATARLRYDVSCPHCTAGMCVPVGESTECPECACPVTLAA